MSTDALSHPLLDSHKVIAWDMDGTLVGGANSEFFRAYILAHPEKEHHIVTFRTGASPRFGKSKLWKDDAIHELLDHGVALDTISATHGIPDELFDQISSKRLIVPGTHDAALYWKAAKSKEIGATVLIDDLVAWTEEGCRYHGIAFIDANDEAFMDVEFSR